MHIVAALLLSTFRATLMHGGVPYEVRLDPGAAHPLQVWSGHRKIAEGLLKSFHPWALQVVDVDGDGVDEIAVGVTKRTPYLRFPHRTLFIMRFDGSAIVRKWTGSTMGRPLLEFVFGPKSPGKPQTLYTLERRMDGMDALSANQWIGFGFRKVGREKAWKHARSLKFRGGKLILRVNGFDTVVSL